jgi:NADPH:quinone reductase-like Zn-dependent oxidoreductase
MPKGWSFPEAATLPTAGLTAWLAIEVEAQVQTLNQVLVLRTGGVSIFALQFAKTEGWEGDCDIRIGRKAGTRGD